MSYPKIISTQGAAWRDYQYPIKGMGEASYKLKYGKSMKMKEVLYVPGLKKNLLSISNLDKKGFIVSFVDGEVIMWPKIRTYTRIS